MITTVKDSVTRWKFRQRLRANDSRLSSGLAQEQSVQALQLGTPDASDHIQKAVLVSIVAVPEPNDSKIGFFT